LLADAGFFVTAMDYETEVVDYAKKRCTLNSNNLKFIQGDILKLSSFLRQKEFDTICHSGVLEHFSDEHVIKSLQEHKKVSHRVIFNVPNSRCKMGPGFFGDERLMANSMWIKLIKQAGYTFVKVYGGYDLPRFLYFFLPGAFFNRRLSFWWKWMSKHSIFICE
jgi:2-polyprenyl-3-methyl-5-hydroxy-6-metoxy-1,4-benzoquinol methylase